MIAYIRMNSTLSSLLNSLSLTLNSPLSANQQNVPASPVNNTSVVANSTPDVNNNTNTSPTAPATNSSTPTAATGAAVENSPTVSFSSLQTELGEVRELTKMSKSFFFSWNLKVFRKALGAGRRIVAAIADNPEQLSLETQVTFLFFFSNSTLIVQTCWKCLICVFVWFCVVYRLGWALLRTVLVESLQLCQSLSSRFVNVNLLNLTSSSRGNFRGTKKKY